ncbi:DUF3085 domain-containing protein [Candidatus Parcubacteria bacterium]|nr:MAG: DUF3085 domain-containing protein [Candidatus Parcubacteria bacterium]
MPESGLMNPEDVDTSKIPPAIWLVKDHGVYLMSNGLPGNGEKSPVVYAEEMDPDSNPDDWYVRAEAVFGGDDCCIALSADIPANVRRANPDGKHLKLSITPGAVMVLCG